MPRFRGFERRFLIECIRFRFAGMSVSIVSCPSCKSLILSDTIQCPTCQHLVKPEKAEGVSPDLPAVERAADDLVSCPDCGEDVRSGLVRCWRCGGFIREEIAETYEKMLEAPQKVTYSDVDDDDDAPLPDLGGGEAETSIASEDDFVLGEGLDFLSPDEVARQQAVVDQNKAPLEQLPDLSQADLDKAVADATARAKEAGSDAADETYGLNADKPAEQTEEVSEETPPDSGLAAKKKKASKPPADDADDEEDEAPPDTGDPLLDIAITEEREAKKRIRKARKQKAKSRRAAGAMAGYVAVFCPNGHRIQVEEKYRGLSGRCPKCKSMFLVPALDWEAEKRAEAEAAEADKKVSRYSDWSLDLHLHKLDPAKLKLKPGSLATVFQESDICYTDDGLLLVVHGKQNAGLFAGEKNKKKKDELRAEVQEYLRLDQELLDLPAAGYRFFSAEDAKKCLIVQPAVYAHESMFAGVPVFGKGRIAVRLPVLEQDSDSLDIMFLSFSLSEFRALSGLFAEKFGIADFGQADGVPLTDDTGKYNCHYSDRELKTIEVTEFHEADKDMEIELIGRKCQACGLAVSEESRKKEKLGGAAGKGIAKAKCPKCEQKFGDTSLFALKSEEAEPDTSMSETGGVPSK